MVPKVLEPLKFYYSSQQVWCCFPQNSSAINSWYLELWYPKVPFSIDKYNLDTFFIFIYTSTHFVSNYWYLKINFWEQKIYFEISVVIPPAYKVCRGVYSFRLSICLSMRPSGVNILRQSFAWSFLYIKKWHLPGVSVPHWAFALV